MALLYFESRAKSRGCQLYLAIKFPVSDGAAVAVVTSRYCSINHTTAYVAPPGPGNKGKLMPFIDVEHKKTVTRVTVT